MAVLAGVSVPYDSRLARGVSDGVLEALARARQLDGAERADRSISSGPPSRPRGRNGADRPVSAAGLPSSASRR